jgi:predicted acylesterase/phospholipase RssA
MTLAEYKNKFPLTKQSYPAADVDKIRSHAFNAGTPEIKETRSQKQNRYYWGVVCKLISDHTGYTPDEIHQILAKKYLSYERIGKPFVLSTTKLKTGEFEAYMEDCRRWASTELSCNVPEPNEPDHFYYEVKK